MLLCFQGTWRIYSCIFWYGMPFYIVDIKSIQPLYTHDRKKKLYENIPPQKKDTGNICCDRKCLKFLIKIINKLFGMILLYRNIWLVFCVRIRSTLTFDLKEKYSTHIGIMCCPSMLLRRFSKCAIKIWFLQSPPHLSGVFLKLNDFHQWTRRTILNSDTIIHKFSLVLCFLPNLSIKFIFMNVLNIPAWLYYSTINIMLRLTDIFVCMYNKSEMKIP